MIEFSSKDTVESYGDSQLNLVMDKSSYTMLFWLKGAIEATSVGEVIRRALQVYELVKPEKLDMDTEGDSLSNNEETKTVHVRITCRTRERIEKEREASGGSYSTVISNSLRVLTQLVRNRIELLKDIEYEIKQPETCDVTISHVSDDNECNSKIKTNNDKSSRPLTVKRGRQATVLLL